MEGSSFSPGPRVAAGERPAALRGRACAAPEQNLECAVTHLEDDRDGLVGLTGNLAARFSLHSRKLPEELG